MGERMRLRRRQPVREEGGGFDLHVREKMQSGRSILCESNDWGLTGGNFGPVRRRPISPNR